jgi:hypothetical protein
MKTIPWILAVALPCAGWAQEDDLRQGGKPAAQVTITSPTSGSTLTSPVVDVAVTFSSPGNGRIDSIELRANGSAVASTDVPKKTPAGTHLFSAVDLSAYDNTGSPVALVARAYVVPSDKKFVDSAAVLVTLKSDQTVPLIASVQPVTGSFANNPKPTLSAQVTDAGGAGVDPASINLKLDGSAVAASVTVVNPNLVNVSFTPSANLASGTHILTVDARDKAGNAAVQATSTFIVDLVAPVAAISAPATGLLTKDGLVGLVASVSDAGGSGLDLVSIVVKLDGVVVTASVSSADPNTASVTFTPPSALGQGGHTYTVVAADRAGNTSATASSSFSVDVMAPALTLSPANGGQVQGPKPTLVVSYSDSPAGLDLSTFHATLDGADISAAFVKGASSASFTPAAALADGLHILRVDLADMLGNLAQVSSLFRIESGLTTIGDQGGTVQITDPTLAGAGAKLVIPPGAVSGDVVFSIETVSSPTPYPEGYVPVGPVLDFFPNISFSQPVTIAIPYDPQLVASLDLSPLGLRLLTFDVATGMWIRIPVLSVDTVNHLLIAQISAINGQQFGVAGQVISSAETSVEASSGATVADGLSFSTLTVVPRGPDGSLAGPNQTIVVHINGVSPAGVFIADLGNGAYEVYIGSFTSGTATVQLTVNGTSLPPQTIQFTPKPAYFTITVFNNPLAAGAPSDLMIQARNSAGALVTTFNGTVEVNLTGTRDAGDNLIYPESFVVTFSSGDAGSLSLVNAVVFARAGSQTVSVQYLLDATISGSTPVTVNPGAPAVLTRLSADRVSGTAGSALPAPLAVRLTDSFGNVISGAQVQFQVVSGGARFNQ